MKGMNMAGLAGFCIIISLLASPAAAALQEITYRGTVTSLDPANNVVTINATHQWGCVFGNNTTNCTWDPIIPLTLNGTSPVSDVFGTVTVGSQIEATSIGGPGGKWIGIGTLFPTPGIENWYARDLFGDPESLPAPLIADYSVTYSTAPDCTNCTGAVCTANSAIVTISRVGGPVWNTSLTPGQNFTYNQANDNSSVYVLFITGQAAATLCPNASPIAGVQPVSTFVVHVNPPIASPVTTTTLPTTTPVTPPTSAPIFPFTVIGALAVLGFLMAIRKQD
jgi:hypothetical protein